ncbi:MAG: S8 family serine peptidase [Bacteroidia bacterium]
MLWLQLVLNVAIQPSAETWFSALEGKEPTARGALGSFAIALEKVTRLTDRYHPMGSWATLYFSTSDTANLLKSLRQTYAFRSIELNRTRRIQSLVGWHHKVIHTTQAWQITMGSSQVLVGVLDTGIDTTLPIFYRQLWVRAGEDLNGNGLWEPEDYNGIDDDGNGYVDDIVGYDFTDQVGKIGTGDYLELDGDPTDENGHGTAMAGLIAARGETYSGIAPGCKILVLRAFNALGVGEDDDIARAILYAADAGVHILNLSFGDLYPSQLMHAAIRYAYQKGVILVGSAGNGVGQQPHYPSDFPEVICVGGVSYDPTSGKTFFWPLSGYGSRLDLTAPAGNILVPYHGGIFTTASGTSISTAITSGCVALVKSYLPHLTPAELVSLLQITAEDVGSPGKDIYYGAGIIRPDRALRFPVVGACEIHAPAPNLHTYQATPVVITAYHALLQRWEVRYRRLSDPFTVWKEGNTPVLAETLGYLALPPSTYELQLRIYLTGLHPLEKTLTITFQPQEPTFRHFMGTWAYYENRPVKAGYFHLSYPAPLYWAWEKEDTVYFLQDRLDTVGVGILPAGAQNTFWAQTYNRRTPPISLPPSPPYLPSTVWEPTGIQIPPGWYEPLFHDWDGDGMPEMLGTPYTPEGKYGNLTFFKKSASAFYPWDSIHVPGSILVRDLKDVEGDPLPELLAVRGDSFFIFQGNPPKRMRYKGKGIAAALDTPSCAWLRNPVSGSFEKLHWPTGTLLLSLPDPTYDGGNTTIPYLLRPRQGNTQGYLFGNYQGHIFAYDAQGNFLWHYDTRLEEVGSHLALIDIDQDGWDEIVYAARTPQAGVSLWEVGFLSPQGNIQERFFFLDPVGGRASLYAADLTGDAKDEIVFHVLPHTYVAYWNGTRWEWIAYEGHSLLLRAPYPGLKALPLWQDTLAEFYHYQAPAYPPPLWEKAYARSSHESFLQWTAVGAPTYQIWRIEGENASLIATTSQTFWQDATLTPGQLYGYVVCATQGAFSEIRWIRAQAPFCPQILKAEKYRLLLQATPHLPEDPTFYRCQAGHPTSVVSSGNRLQLLWQIPLTGTLTLHLDSLLTSKEGVVIDAFCLVHPFHVPDSATQCVFIRSWHATPEGEIEIRFSEPLPTLNPDSLRLIPHAPIEWFALEGESVRLRMGINPHARMLTLIFPAVRSSSGATLCQRHLSLLPSQLLIYPNPVPENFPYVTLSGLEKAQVIEIWSPLGELVKKLFAPVGFGLWQWDLSDLQGRKVSPGPYLLHIQTEEKEWWEKVFVK